MPRCESLPSNAPQCLRVLQTNTATGVGSPPAISSKQPPHWCYVESGRLYEGEIATTKSNKACLPWSQSTSTEFNTNIYPELRRAKNHCRNAGGLRPEPWCYTLSSSNPTSQPVEESCAVPKCPPNMYPELREGQPTTPDLVDSLSNVWRSLAGQWQFGTIHLHPLL